MPRNTSTTAQAAEPRPDAAARGRRALLSAPVVMLAHQALELPGELLEVARLDDRARGAGVAGQPVEVGRPRTGVQDEDDAAQYGDLAHEAHDAVSREAGHVDVHQHDVRPVL